MHPAIYQAFEVIFDRWPPPGPDVLELGATANPKAALLTALARRNPTGHYIGMNLSVTTSTEDEGQLPSVDTSIEDQLPYLLVEGNANDLSRFSDASFDAVVTNATLEHDRAFWLTTAEAHRVLRPGGLFYVGIPGYSSTFTFAQRVVEKLDRLQITGTHSLVATARRQPWYLSTPTFTFHPAPGDYYRFSADTLREVIFAGMECLMVTEIMKPPRLLGVGRKRTKSSD